jgi:hypothetical protein
MAHTKHGTSGKAQLIAVTAECKTRASTENCREKAQKAQPGRAGTKGARPSGRFTDGLAPAASENPDTLDDGTLKRPEGRAPVAGENVANNARFSPIAVQRGRAETKTVTQGKEENEGPENLLRNA